MSTAKLQHEVPRAPSPAGILAWVSLVEGRCGVHFSAGRAHQLVRALEQRMRQLGIADYADYYRRVTSSAGAGEEWNHLLDVVTNHETRFFRHLPTFDAMREFVEKRSSPASIAVWSAGCSTGEEAYSAAMVCCGAPTVHCSILASDVSEAVLTFAAAARYPSRVGATIPERYQQYLIPALDGKSIAVAKPVQSLVRFSRLNLLDFSRYPTELFDVVLCQNVLVYFQTETRRRVLSALLSRLKPGGWFLPGPGEIADLQSNALRCIRMGDAQVFVKQQARPAQASAGHMERFQ
jgi:type IV pilus assembly protein PilK